MYALTKRNTVFLPQGDPNTILEGRELTRYRRTPLAEGYILNVVRFYENNNIPILVLKVAITSYVHVRADTIDFLRTPEIKNIVSFKDAIKFLRNPLFKGERVAVIDDDNYGLKSKLPLMGEVSNVTDRSYIVRLDESIDGEYEWGFSKFSVISEKNLDPHDRMISINYGELIDTLKSNKPPEHILLDIEDLITN